MTLPILNANTNQTFNYNGNQITFQLGNGDVMVNATQMAKVYGKRVNDYLNLTSTKELIDAFTRKNGKLDNQVVTTKTGFPEFGGGTWMHKTIALDFAQWLSVDLRLWCLDRIEELLQHGITATPQKINELIEDPDLIIQLATNLKEERRQKEILEERNRLQEESLRIQAPKATYYDEVMQSKSTYTVNQIAKELGMGSITLNRLLFEKNIQYKQSNTWVLYAKYQDKGYTKTKTYSYTRDNDEVKTRMQTVWTEKGRVFIHKVVKG